MKVVFEFEVGDIPWCDDPNDPACKENVIDVFHGMVLHVLDKKIILVSNDISGAMKMDEHSKKANEEETLLTHRIMAGIKFIGRADEDAKPAGEQTTD